MNRLPGYKPKIRNSYHRKRKGVLLLATEGKNKTETKYFRSIQNPNYIVQFAPGNYTDPVNMIRALKKEYKEQELDKDLGDAAFCLVDSDVDPAKDKQLEKADTEASSIIKMIVSSPCFEIWYLCHFTSSSRLYPTNNDVLKALRQYIPEYRKEMPGIWKIIGNKTDMAIRNAKLLEKQCQENGYKTHTVAFSPSTEVYKIMEILK